MSDTLAWRGAALTSTGCALLLVLSGCAETQPGTPSAAGTSTTMSTSKGTSVPTTSSRGSDTGNLENVKPCDLVSAEDLARFGATAGKPRSSGGTNSCNVSIPGKFNVQINVRPTKGINDLNKQGFQVSSERVGNRDAVKSVDQGNQGSCAIDMAVTEKSSAGVIGTGASGDAAAGCQIAMDFAKIIEPKLP